MAFRDPHAILLNRSSILVVTGVGVGLLTLSYVLGVQVGKQSAALQRPASKGSGEELKALPAPILDQLNALDGMEADPASKPDPQKEAKAPVKPAAAPGSKPESRPEPKPMPTAVAPGPVARWTLQLVSTPDRTEADRVAGKAKAAGYPSQVVKDGSIYKVRWSHAGAKAEVDVAATKMKAAGFKPFAVPVE